MIDITKINFKKMDGLVPAIIQNVETKQVLMLGYMNEEAVQKTLEIKRVTFWSRSKQRLWTKGETSGNFLNVLGVNLDCDGDAVLVEAKPEGPTCHKGDVSCFAGTDDVSTFLSTLAGVIDDRKKMLPKGSYTTSLFEKGVDEIIGKVEEESEEVCRAARDETKERLAEEAGDLLYHLLVLLSFKDVSWNSVLEVLRRRS